MQKNWANKWLKVSGKTNCFINVNKILVFVCKKSLLQLNKRNKLRLKIFYHTKKFKQTDILLHENYDFKSQK